MASTQILLENLLLRSATKECHYLILLLPEEPQTNLLRESEDKVLQEISHFEIQGQHCAIIEAENTSLTIEPPVTKVRDSHIDS